MNGIDLPACQAKWILGTELEGEHSGGPCASSRRAEVRETYTGSGEAELR